MAGLMNKGRISTTYVNPVDKGGKGMALAVFCVWWLVYSREEIHKEYIRFLRPTDNTNEEKYILLLCTRFT